MRGLLQILMLPISLIALYALFVGVAFGSNLWNPNAPLVTVIWLLIVASPLWFYGLLYWSKDSRRKTTALFTVTLVSIAVGVGHFLTH
jgi:hypothetical protein